MIEDWHFRRTQAKRTTTDNCISKNTCIGIGFPRVDTDQTLVESSKMATSDDANVMERLVERARSGGIGGAGNMRRPSEVKAAQALSDANNEGRMLHNMYLCATQKLIE